MAVIYWYNLLTRNNMFCTLCYRVAQEAWVAETAAGLPHPPDREPWVRIADVAWFEQGITAYDPRTRAAYITKLRAAFMAHMKAVHPNPPLTVSWTRNR